MLIRLTIHVSHKSVINKPLNHYTITHFTMKRIAVFPGSFDPFTIGHESIVRRSLPLFDKVIVAVGYNSAKQGFFPIEKRMAWINDLFANEHRISVEKYEGLTVDFCKLVNANFLLRGLRTAADFEFERAIGQMNHKLLPELETIFMLTEPEHSAITSTIVREIFKYGGNVAQFIPEGIELTK